MHPILARSGRLAAYIVMWVPPGVLLAALLALQRVVPWRVAFATAVPLSIAYWILCLSAWYVAAGSPINRTGPLRIATTVSIAAFISSAMWLLIGRGWLGIVASVVPIGNIGGAFRAAAPTIFGFGFLLYLLAMAISYFGIAFEASREAERRALETEVLAREAELRALRAQIDPHFLFNSLQSISALTTADPAAARRMCLLLADFLRETLALGARERIPLSSELAIATRFLAIEQVRFGDRLRVELAANAADQCLVPPLVLQPLVENAVTHGIAHVLEGGVVRIAAARGGATLRISIDNPCDRDRPAGRGSGVGLTNVRARLRTLYGRDATLSTEEKEGRFIASVEVPVETSGSGDVKM